VNASSVCSASGIGICSAGKQTCSSSGFWGICVADNTPISEICNNNLDDDCDGAIDSNDSDCQQSGGGGGNGGGGGGGGGGNSPAIKLGDIVINEII